MSLLCYSEREAVYRSQLLCKKSLTPSHYFTTYTWLTSSYCFVIYILTIYLYLYTPTVYYFEEQGLCLIHLCLLLTKQNICNMEIVVVY